MAATYEIPITPASNQTFSVVLNDVAYQLTLQWRAATDAGWVLDIADESGTALVCGIPLVTGIDLLGQHQHLGIGGSLYVATDGDQDAAPTFDSLGDTSHLYWVSAA
ncbi:phage baseplate plug family protein [Xanthobacter agilis]|uniref:Cyanophage baseplate Pam3 plug gp18 domain-containing protein n=1 Tax=Xanthobacter agilis TaxID=47492 RepID=A0ABU0LJW7_XANAG|nr:hypothetical protein [Xanthobacter agilis]MDQ0507423.1 hypothetical protein [Xanthobacter agilis]